MAAEVIGEVFETAVREGITYLVRKVTNAVGKKVKQFFRDEDGDGVPDTEEPEFEEDDEEEGETGGETSGGEGEYPITPLPETSGSELPPANTSTATQDIGKIVVITPEGPVTMYMDNDAQNYAELVSVAEERWLERYGATTKDFANYSVSEALLFIIAGCALAGLFAKIFKRRKL